MAAGEFPALSLTWFVVVCVLRRAAQVAARWRGNAPAGRTLQRSVQKTTVEAAGPKSCQNEHAVYTHQYFHSVLGQNQNIFGGNQSSRFYCYECGAITPGTFPPYPANNVSKSLYKPMDDLNSRQISGFLCKQILPVKEKQLL